MSKTNPEKTASTEAPKSNGKTASTKTTSGFEAPRTVVRETIESVVIAFVLAFMFRTFEAEAFVIPTGSMAPTLQGRHKDLECSVCSFPFRVSTSQEYDEEKQLLRANATFVVCPQCRHKLEVAPDRRGQTEYPSYNGDRILVNKFSYQFTDPERWDVAVFRFPWVAKENYIKRVIGLPKETVRISNGNIFTRPEGQSEFTVARKPADKVLATLQTVYDNNYLVDSMIDEQGLPPRWQPAPKDLSRLLREGWPKSSRAWAWPPAKNGDPKSLVTFETTDNYRSFAVKGLQANQEAYLRYQHFVPNLWTDPEEVAIPEGNRVVPQLVSDFCAADTARFDPPAGSWLPTGGHWVGDLALSCEVNIESAEGEIVLELIEGGQRFHAVLDAASGEVALLVDDNPIGGGSTGESGPGAHSLRFANIDDQLIFWVDGDIVAQANYDSPQLVKPTNADLSPAAVIARGCDLSVSDLTLLRDIYYIALGHNDKNWLDYDADTEALGGIFLSHAGEDVYALLLSRPEEYARLRRYTQEFELGEGDFLMLGDNSPQSSDGRVWRPTHENGFDRPEFHVVKRELLVGKAVFVFWPHGWGKVPGIGLPVPLNLWPNFERMRPIR